MSSTWLLRWRLRAEDMNGTSKSKSGVLGTILIGGAECSAVP